MMRNITDKECIEMLDAYDDTADQEAAHSQCEALLMSFLRGNGYGKVAEAYEAARDRVGFWYA